MSGNNWVHCCTFYECFERVFSAGFVSQVVPIPIVINSVMFCIDFICSGTNIFVIKNSIHAGVFQIFAIVSFYVMCLYCHIVNIREFTSDNTNSSF